MRTQDAPRLAGYEAQEHLGSGGCAEVWAMRDPAGDLVAVKFFRTDSALSGRGEWKALRRFGSDHVVPARDLLTDDDGRPALVMELCAGGTLEDTVVGRGGLTVGETASALAPIADVVARMHQDGVVHGDLSPRNILLTAEGKPMLADLGCLRGSRDPTPSSWCTDGFTAPEVLDGDPPRPASDVYALGALAWFALTGRPPEPPALRPHLPDVLPEVPTELAEAIAAALSLTPEARIGADRLGQTLLAAGRAVPVPVPRREPAERVGVTYRRRAEAVRRQRSDRRPTKAGVRPQRRRRLVGGAALGLGCVAVAVCWPTPSGSKDASLRASATVSSKRSSGASASSGPTSPAAPKRTITPVFLPHRAELEELLACRAESWNARSVTSLSRCLAPKSQALTDDTARLRAANQQGVNYSGLSYRVRSVQSLVIEQGQPTARLTIAQSAYTVRDTGGTRQVPAADHRVRLTFSGSPGTWKLTSWNVL